MILLSSCYSTKRLIRESKFKSTDFNKENISGFYKNIVSDSITLELWKTLKESYTFEPDTTVNDKAIVKLTLTDNQHLNVKLLRNETILDELNLIGKIKDDYFSIDRNLSFVPLFPIYYVHRETKTIIGNDKFGNLIVVDGFVGEGFILFMGAGTRNVNSYKYNRIKN